MYANLNRFVGETVEIIYLDSRQSISQRTIKVLSADAGFIHAYCYRRGGPRTFRRDQILAVMPAARRAAGG